MASKLKVSQDTADKAFAKMPLDDVFDLDYAIYKEYFEALQSKETNPRIRSALTRDFNQNGGRISNKIRRTFKGAAQRAGYRVRLDGRFDKTLGSAMDVLRRRKQ